VTRSVHVIIVSYCTRDDTLACLASLHRHPPASLDRITVVDNASTDGSVDAVRRAHPSVEVIALDRNMGFGAANNAAARKSSSPHLLFLNSDTLVGEGAVDRLLDRLHATGAVAAGPRLVDASGRPEVSFGSMLTPWSEFGQMLRQRRAASAAPAAQRATDRLVSQERTVDWVSGACLLVNREAMLAAGGFDERYFMYEEDVDLCAALRARGGSILFTPAAEIVHLRGRSIGRGAAPAGLSHYDRSHLAFYEKHAPHWAPWLRRWLRFRGRSIE
jgi:GT2 family glycosyltransferase